MDSTVPADLLKLKARLEAWRATRKYTRQPIPDEFRQAAAEMARRYSPSLIRRILKLDPWRLKKPESKRSDRFHRKPQTTFFTLPPDIALPEPRPLATSLAAGCRLLVERPDGARLALTLPSLDLAAITQLCADTCVQGGCRTEVRPAPHALLPKAYLFVTAYRFKPHQRLDQQWQSLGLSGV